MEEREKRTSGSTGRPKISELEKKRRAVRRQDERCRELRQDLRERGWEEHKPKEGPGRPPKLRQEKVFDELLKLRRMIHDLRRYEREKDERHVPLHEIRDPLVENKTLYEVGRRPADELTELDYEIKVAMSTIAKLVKEVDKHQSIFPKKPPHGRTPKTRLEKIEFQAEKLIEKYTRVKEIENGLDNTQRISRQIKLLFDEAKKARAKARVETGTLKQYYVVRNETLYEDINRLKDHIREVNYKRDQLGLDVGAHFIEINHHYDHDINATLREVERINKEYGF